MNKSFACDVCGLECDFFAVREPCKNCKTNARFVKIGFNQSYPCQ